ncbi:unnamed protein product [Lactuca virosa]|uniref:F-box domain-containing protein n=1 Tax=Lactuca virosa TaxID=75947 RepID=A0AAU9MN12_9ASTR|nr:unnamed protein product [Lactuca virosa]
MKKFERPKASKGEDRIDLISNMPDSILLLILSLLSSTEEVIIRSSILSRRWRYLWTSIPSLDLFSRFHREDKLKKDEFKDFVFWVLANRSVDLDCLDLGCFDHYTLSTVRRWIHMAVTRNVKQLHLMFYPQDENEDVEMPPCLVSCVSLEVLGLNLSYHRLRLTNIMGFPALRDLDLIYVDLLGDRDVVKAFFESFPLLEGLSLISCFMNERGLLYISCPKLKVLRIENENDELMCDSIKICCPKLVDLELRGLIANNFFFECLDSLNKAEIEPKLTGNIKSVLIPGISHVEHLWIDLYFFSQCINAARDPALPNLKTLALTTGVDAFTMDIIRILKCYPKVESLKLIVKEKFDGPEEWELHEGEARRLMTPDVKRVEFFEFKGEKPKFISDWEEDVYIWKWFLVGVPKPSTFSVDYDVTSFLVNHK